MREMKVTLSPDQSANKLMRNILGINNSPRITTVARRLHDKALFDALNFRYVRYHDAPLENPGQQLIDIRRIFPLIHADESDSRNYLFGQCDDYLSVIADSDAQIDFRLGETIDHSGNARMIGVPEDIDKWARICRNIIGHYKNGEMNGMRLNIRQVTIWEEPDNPKLLSGTVDDYSRMFCAVYKLLKRDFPDLMVGGPTIMSNSLDFLQRFLENCKAEGVTPDYVTATIYSRDLETIPQKLSAYHAIAQKTGFPEMRIRLAEWHLGPVDWKQTNNEALNGFRSSINAAYSVSTLVDMMDIAFLDAAYYYAWATSCWSVMNLNSPEMEPLPVYWGLMLYQKLGAQCSQRLATTVENGGNVRVLAGRTKDGRTRLLISCYEESACTIKCEVGSSINCTLSSVEPDGSYTEGKELIGEKGSFTVVHQGGSGVYLLEF